MITLNYRNGAVITGWTHFPYLEEVPEAFQCATFAMKQQEKIADRVDMAMTGALPSEI